MVRRSVKPGEIQIAARESIPSWGDTECTDTFDVPQRFDQLGRVGSIVSPDDHLVLERCAILRDSVAHVRNREPMLQ